MSRADDALTPAEQHLGDRLAALVDGELGHDSRERVLSHLATCRNCKAEADAQRRLKSVFADTAPPPPSAGLLARLQGLPGGADQGGPAGGRPAASAGDGPGGGPGREERSPLSFEYLAGGRGTRSADSPLTPQRGFRTHRFGEAERAASRGRRLAFAAAGAFSLAALALSGTFTPVANGVDASGNGERGASASPVRSTTPSSTSAERGRRGTGRQRGHAGSGATAKSAVPTTLAAASAPRDGGRPGASSTAAPRGQLYPLLEQATGLTPPPVRPLALPAAQKPDFVVPPGVAPDRYPLATPAPAPLAPAATAASAAPGS
ncbi:MAG TPA: zf-HC2 domain-containing protein [Streptomyces sp.]|nr:zf-HC2 domain-containing protein [Streptomyces sp.]